MTFVKAERKQTHLKIALTGPSGSGKTYSALQIAKGIGGRVAVIDTENRSASLYSHLTDFDIAELEPPFLVSKYINTINAAIVAKYDVLIIDSLSHAWAGEGGILDRKAQMDSRGGNSFTNWKSLTPEQEKFISAILQSNIHIICTIRSKQEYSLDDGESGKKTVQKHGMAPIQREGMEYEFTTVFDLAMDHSAKASKDRTDMFDKRIFKPTPETGQEFMRWLGNVPKPAQQAPAKAVATPQNSVGKAEVIPLTNNAPVVEVVENPGDVLAVKLPKGSVLEGLTIPEAWERKRAGAIAYAYTVYKKIKTGKAKVGPTQTAFVEYGVQNKFIDEAQLERSTT